MGCNCCFEPPIRGTEQCRQGCIYDDDENARDDICEEGISSEAFAVNAFGYTFTLWTCNDCIWYGSQGGYTITMDGAAGEVTVTDPNGNTATYDIVGSWNPLCTNTFRDPDATLGLEILCIGPKDPPECPSYNAPCFFGEACDNQTTRRWTLRLLGVNKTVDLTWDEEAGGCVITGEVNIGGRVWTVLWSPLDASLVLQSGSDSHTFILKRGDDPKDEFIFFPPSDACHFGYACLDPTCDTPSPVQCGDYFIPYSIDTRPGAATFTIGSENEYFAEALEHFNGLQVPLFFTFPPGLDGPAPPDEATGCRRVFDAGYPNNQGPYGLNAISYYRPILYPGNDTPEDTIFAAAMFGFFRVFVFPVDGELQWQFLDITYYVEASYGGPFVTGTQIGAQARYSIPFGSYVPYGERMTASFVSMGASRTGPGSMVGTGNTRTHSITGTSITMPLSIEIG